MPEIAVVRYPHEGIIDAIVENPSISQRELAREFGYTESWMSIIINSDSFQHRLAERKAELVDPKLIASIEARMDALGKKALDKLLERLDTNMPFSNGELIAAAKLGVGDRGSRPPAAPQQNLFVVQIPPPANSAQEWMASAKAKAVDISHTNPEA